MHSPRAVHGLSVSAQASMPGSVPLKPVLPASEATHTLTLEFEQHSGSWDHGISLDRDAAKISCEGELGERKNKERQGNPHHSKNHCK